MHAYIHTCILLLSDTLTFGDIKFVCDRTFSKEKLSGFLAPEFCLKKNNKNSDFITTDKQSIISYAM
jgi:hypothetical protein